MKAGDKVVWGGTYCPKSIIPGGVYTITGVDAFGSLNIQGLYGLWSTRAWKPAKSHYVKQFIQEQCTK